VPSQTKKTLDLLRRFESRNVTFIAPDGSWPIVWERAKGNYVWDCDGRRYLDLTGAFGVTAAGHCNPRVIKAGQRQLAKLAHAMGDVHPHALKAELARELSRITFERWCGASGKVVFCNSGFEAVEAALKTALLATGKRGVVAFRGAYHGLGYGALNTTHRAHFREPFRSQLGGFGHFVEFPVAEERLEMVGQRIGNLLRKGRIGAVLVEPVQARGGINVPCPGFLAMLRKLCHEHEALLVLDEIYTGMGRTGKWFACEHEKIWPDLVCLGKALTGGFPLSACVGRAAVMDKAWPASNGEAIHTSTFLGHPVGCAMALAQIAELKEQQLIARAASVGKRLLDMLGDLKAPPGLRLKSRGLGLLAGLEVILDDGASATELVLGWIKVLLRQGFILLPEGEDGNVVAFSPPLTIGEKQLTAAVTVLKNLLEVSQNQTVEVRQRRRGRSSARGVRRVREKFSSGARGRELG
jgi:4-aminobutyrate aminotransferase-like enzyme